MIQQLSNVNVNVNLTSWTNSGLIRFSTCILQVEDDPFEVEEEEADEEEGDEEEVDAEEEEEVAGDDNANTEEQADKVRPLHKKTASLNFHTSVDANRI